MLASRPTGVPFGNRADLDRAVAEEEREQPLAGAEQAAQLVGNVAPGIQILLSVVVRSIKPTPGPLSLAKSRILASRAPATASARSDAWKTRMRASTDGLGSKGPTRVVLQERRRRPDADERGRPREAASAARQLVVVLRAGHRIAHLDRADRRQLLVGLRREVVPDVAGDRVGRDRAADVGLHQRRRHAQLGRQVVVLQEVVGQRRSSRIGVLNSVGLGPRPVRVPSTPR